MFTYYVIGMALVSETKLLLVIFGNAIASSCEHSGSSKLTSDGRNMTL